jgi:hypothetical protein
LADFQKRKEENESGRMRERGRESEREDGGGKGSDKFVEADS